MLQYPPGVGWGKAGIICSDKQTKRQIWEPFCCRYGTAQTLFWFQLNLLEVSFYGFGGWVFSGGRWLWGFLHVSFLFLSLFLLMTWKFGWKYWSEYIVYDTQSSVEKKRFLMVRRFLIFFPFLLCYLLNPVNIYLKLSLTSAQSASYHVLCIFLPEKLWPLCKWHCQPMLYLCGQSMTKRFKIILQRKDK